MVSIAASVIPEVVRALNKGNFEVEKDFGGQEKFWGGLGNLLVRTIPMVLNALPKSGSGKGFAEDSVAGDPKFWGALARVAASALPALINELTKPKELLAPAGDGGAKTMAVPNGANSSAAPAEIVSTVAQKVMEGPVMH